METTTLRKEMLMSTMLQGSDGRYDKRPKLLTEFCKVRPEYTEIFGLNVEG